jgi:hypothetical protein
MICRLRYRVLEAGTTVRNVSVCIVILLGSYIASTFVNASPVTRPSLTGPRTRVVYVAPTEEKLQNPVEMPSALPEAEIAPRPVHIQSL